MKSGKSSPFGFRDAQESTGFLLWQVTHAWQRRITETLRPLGLTHLQFVLLSGTAWLTLKEKDVFQVRLARFLKVDVMVTSKGVRSLEAKGLLARKTLETDSRSKVLALTPRGLRKIGPALKAVEMVDRSIFGATGIRGELNGKLLKVLARADSTGRLAGDSGKS